MGLSYFQVGLIALAFTFSSAIVQPVFGLLSDRYSMPWLMPFGLALSGLGLALTGSVNSFGLLLLVVLLSGVGVAGYHPEGSKLAHFVSAEGRAGFSMAIFSVGGNLGYGLGPILAVFVLSFSGLNSVHGIMIPGLLVALAFLFLLPGFKAVLAGKAPRREVSAEPAAVSAPGWKGHLILLLLFVMVRSWIQAGIVYFIPFYYHGLQGLSSPEYLVTIFLIAGAAGTVLGGPFADRFGGRSGLLVSMIISLFVLYPFLHLQGAPVPILAFLAGAALISSFSTSVVFGQRLLPHNIGLASGLMLGFGVGMGSVGVTLLGAIADLAGLPLVMNVISLLPVLGIIFALTLPDIRAGQLTAGVEPQPQPEQGL